MILILLDAKRNTKKHEHEHKVFSEQRKKNEMIPSKIQLKEYKKDPYFFPLSKNMATDCLLIYMFCTCFEFEIAQKKTITILDAIQLL